HLEDLSENLQEKRPSTETTCFLMDQTLVQDGRLTTGHPKPILLDKSTVPWGQMLPVGQDQILSASFQTKEDNCINKQSAFRNFTLGSFTQSALSHMLPEMGSVPSCGVTSGPTDPDGIRFNETYAPQELNYALRNADFLLEHSESHLIDQHGRREAENLTNQKFISVSQNQTSTACSNDLISVDRTNTQSEVACKSFVLDADSNFDAVSPQWLDLFLDGRGNLCFPDTNLEESVFSPKTGSI
ncbi:hypothetical protein XENORESO_005271, partial [Xenotaenia resolanae]